VNLFKPRGETITEIKDNVFNLGKYLFEGEDNPVIKSIPYEHKIYAQLIGKTYDGDRENIGGYEYQKSLNLPNTMTPAAMAGIATAGIGVGIHTAIKSQSIKVKMAGYAGLDISPQRTFLNYVFPSHVEDVITGQYPDQLLPDDTGLDYPIDIMEDIVEPYNVLPIPKGFALSLLAASSIGIYMNGLRNLKAEKETSTGLGFKKEYPFYGNIPIAPRMNYYRKGNEDVFSIRGTATYEDLGNDAILGIGDRFSPTLKKKMDIYEKFINDNSRGKDITIVGHSLGQREMSMLMSRMTNKNINGVGYGVPFFNPDPNSINYSFKYDPLYVKNGMDNHKVIEKPFKKYNDRFAEHHSISNYF